MHVAILGCGYVGTCLARQLSDEGHSVTAVRRSWEDPIEGADCREADVTDESDLVSLPDVDWLVFSASTGGGGPEAARALYVDGLETVLLHYADREEPPDRLVYTSSTGVYGDHGGDWVDETTELDPQTPKTEALAEAERVARETTDVIDGTVARLAGIYGPDRYRLERYLAGPVTEGYLNMIHQVDAAGAIAHLLETDEARDEIVLLIDDEPVDKWDFADWLAAQCGEPEPPKQTVEERLAENPSGRAKRRLLTSKRCSNDRLHELGYDLAHSTYRSGYSAAIEGYRGR